MAAIFVVSQPGANLRGRVAMVNLGDEERPMRRKKASATTEDFMLATLHVDLYELRHRPAVRDEIIECDRGHLDQFSGAQNRRVRIRFYTSMGSSNSTAPESNTVRRM